MVDLQADPVGVFKKYRIVSRRPRSVLGRVDDSGTIRWVEVCYCPTPLQEEREYWEEYFVLEKVQDAHARSRCKDLNGTEPWSCGDCDCTARLEAHLARKGSPFR